MRRIAIRLLSLLCLAPLCFVLVACGSGGPSTRGGGYVGASAPIECAPFARALTGVSLSGAAADWWGQADGRYVRTRSPEVGSIVVFRRFGRLPSGHVSVVTRVLSRRQIMVTSANWVHHRITEDQPVLDTSENGDWSVVRVWWPPSGQMGVTEYPILGFIRPDRPATHDRLIAATPAAVRIAEQGW